MRLLVLLLLILLVAPGCSAESTDDRLVATQPTVLPSPPAAVSSPVDRQVFQMNDARRGAIRIVGSYTGDVVSVQARATVMPGGSGKSTKWVTVASKLAGGKYSGELMVDAGGWYKVDIRTIDKANAMETGSVEHVGVGLVFITSGQSNSLCSGPEPLKADDRASTFNGSEWRQGSDPQLGFTGNIRSGGSQWSVMMDILVKKLNVPVAVTLCGYGGQPVRMWQVDGKHYDTTRDALNYVGKNGCAAILWHQGESDSMEATPANRYAEMLQTMIDTSRSDAKWMVPWIIARVSYIYAIPGTEQEKAAKQAAVIAGQKAVCDKKHTFIGPTTDDLTGVKYRKDGAHFTTAGLLIHGERWADSLIEIFQHTHPKWVAKK